MALQNDGVESEFRQTMDLAKSGAEVIGAVFSALVEYWERKNTFAPQTAMAKYIKKSGPVVSINPKENKTEIKFELEKRKIPFIEMTNGAILFPKTLKDEVREICRNVNIASNCYYQEISRREMENAIVEFRKGKKSTVLTVHNLDPYLAETLKNKCNDISKGFMVGTEAEDGNRISITVLDTNVYTNEDRKDFCKAYLEALTSYYGPNHNRKIMQLEADLEFEKDLYSLLDKTSDGETRYIVGVDEEAVKNVVEITDQDFRHYQFKKDSETGEMVSSVLLTVDKDDISYKEELQRVVDKIQNKSLITDSNLVNEHIISSDRIIDTLRPDKSKEEYYLALTFSRMNEKIDRQIHKELSSDTDNLSPVQYFNRYREKVEAIYTTLGSENRNADVKEDDFIKELKESFNADIKRMNEALKNDGIPKEKGSKEILKSFTIISSKMSKTKVEQHTARSYTNKEIKEALNYDLDNR